MAKSFFSQSITDLINSIRRYFDIRFTQVKLEVMEKTARIISLIIAAVFLLTLFMLFLIFISFAAALWVGELLQSQALGYLCVAGFYLIVGLLTLILRRRLFLGAVISHLSEIFFEEKNIDSDEEN
ncbi:MAG: phage holin family protein [Bacteroidales bacterium]|nr:phage holin family protein [Bacteroidales bacterium]